jgi:hypothetical protein
MDIITGRPNHIEDYLGTLNIGYGGWFGWSDSNNKVYDNLILHPKIFDCSKQELVETHITSFPTEQECIDGLEQMQFDFDMTKLRAKRNKDLQDSDWTQLPDNTLTSEQRNAWMQFRTELRNITDGLTTVEQVNNVDYPDQPNG